MQALRFKRKKYRFGSVSRFLSKLRFTVITTMVSMLPHIFEQKHIFVCANNYARIK